MSGLSGFDSETVGFDSITRSRRSESSSSTQTSFQETGTGSQTHLTKDCGALATPDDVRADGLPDYPPPGLNEFLRKVVPSMLEQLDQKDNDLYSSSDSEDETVVAKLLQEIQVKRDMPGLAAGDFETAVLSLSWSSAGNSLAVSIGTTQHEQWCQHDGLIRIYTMKRSEQDKLVHTMDISEKNCISVLRYHPTVSALLAYGTATGEVVLCNLRNPQDGGMQLSSPSGTHGSKRVSFLHWADAPLANTFLTAQITRTGRRRGASDQILISGGSDGTMNVFQVNANSETFEYVICYTVNGNRKAAPDITCFDFVKTCPLRPCDEKVCDDIFVVGTKNGELFMCKIKTETLDVVDPVIDVLNGHQTCVMDVMFSYQKPGVFVSVSIDSEIRVYHVNQNAPLKIFCVDDPVTCVGWLPNDPNVVLLGVQATQPLQLLSLSSGKAARVAELAAGTLHALAVCYQGSCRIAAGDSAGAIRIWNLPPRRIALTSDDVEF